MERSLIIHLWHLVACCGTVGHWPVSSGSSPQVEIDEIAPSRRLLANSMRTIILQVAILWHLWRFSPKTRNDQNEVTQVPQWDSLHESWEILGVLSSSKITLGWSDMELEPLGNTWLCQTFSRMPWTFIQFYTHHWPMFDKAQARTGLHTKSLPTSIDIMRS